MRILENFQKSQEELKNYQLAKSGSGNNEPGGKGFEALRKVLVD